MMEKFSTLILVTIISLIYLAACSAPKIGETSTPDVALYKTRFELEIRSYENISKAIGLSSMRVDHHFINKRESFFDENGQRRFEVLILPAPLLAWEYFGNPPGTGINCEGVENIYDFIESGGSVIGLCWFGSALFSSNAERFQCYPWESQRGLWDCRHSFLGFFYRMCGSYAFKGVISGPQESNRPYPKSRFLPIKMNATNEIVQQAKLPRFVHQLVVGGGSIIPSQGQLIDIVGWYPNGTVAIGVVPYGKGHIIMSNPHPNITGEDVKALHSEGWETHVRKDLFWTEDMISKEKQVLKNMIDPDGWEPDWALAKGMLSYAYKKAREARE
jgi:glutamine amidotransferase-like uncharacterized protein